MGCYILKKVLFIIFSMVVLTVRCFSISADYAALTVKNGDTHLATLAASELNSSQLDEYKKWYSSSSRMILRSDNGGGLELYYLVDVYPTADIKITKNSISGVDVLCYGADLEEIVGYYTYWQLGEDNMLHIGSAAPITGRFSFNRSLILSISSDLQNGVNFPSPTSDYVIEYDGSLIISDNLDGNTPDEQGGILGFLSNFWDSFKSALKGLFVPSDNFFSSWYSEIKSAFDEKLGAVSSLYNQLTGFLEGIPKQKEDIIIKNDSLGLEASLFDFSLFGDLFSFVRPILTGFVMLLTWIFCYKKIISLVKD